METNNLLKIADWVFRIGAGGSVLLAVLFLGIGVHWSFDKSAYDSIQFTENGLGLVYSFSEASSTATSPGLSEVWKLAFYGNLLKAILYFLVTARMLWIGSGVVRAVLDKSAFLHHNAKALKQLAYGFLALMLITAFRLQMTDVHFSFSFNVSFGYLVATMGCFVLSQVFAEGQHLAEENQHTI
jgi:hypothetical protein